MNRTLLCALLALPASLSAAEPSRKEAAFFENEIRPLLVSHCVKCHGPARQESNFRLDTHAGLRKGGDLGPVIKGKDPRRSLLIQAVKQTGELKMPPKKRLTQREIDLLIKWVKLGAPWPKGKAIAKAGAKLRGGPITKAERAFWSFQPIKNPALPTVKDRSWVRNEIDLFVRRKLEQQRLSPVRSATREELIRRATYDLTGLPPNPRQRRSFLDDKSPGAYERLVDRLLASPAYGERWGRHWLDVVRYADTAGETADFPVPQAYLYRNWVVRALNGDKPYDQFIREQIAGDLIGLKSKVGADRYRQLVTATGFVAISRRFGFNISGYHNLTIQDTIDTIGQAVLGLSLGCARCHDHKYDPVNKEDYYAWYGIFSSTRYANPGCESSKRPQDFAPVVPLAKAQSLAAAHKKRLSELNASIGTLKRRLQQQEARLKSLAPYLTAKGNRQLWNPFSSSVKARLLINSVLNVDGHRGFHVWRPSTGALPIVGVSLAKSTLQVPGTVQPKMVVLHPSQRGAVAIAWRSPIRGRIRVTGVVADAHACGDSVGWYIDRMHRKGFDPLAGGSLLKTRRADFADKKHAKLREIQVLPGDFIQFSILPQSSYGCDLTSVNLRITTLSGKKRAWDLSRSLSSPQPPGARPNPHPDANGVKDVWHFYDLPLHRGTKWLASFAKVTDVNKAVAEANKLNKSLTATRGALTAASSERDRLNRDGAFDVVYGVVDGKIADARLQRRGNKLDLGPSVRRRNLAILGGRRLRQPKRESGRLDLANWLTAKDNPLTARVIANRVWQHHFGAGLVRTENDFGVRGERPTHPQLLDWLATYLVDGNWSLKRLHRKIMLSGTYRLSSDYDERAVKRDPDAKYLWRFNRRRLSAEEYRDSLLLIAGVLDRGVGGEHPFPPPSRWSFSQHAPFYGLYLTDKRSIYLMQQRLKRHPFLALFDGADPNVSTARRSNTTTPTQALYLMNDKFVHRCSSEFAERLLEKRASPKERITAAYIWCTSRQPDKQTVERSVKFLDRYERELRKLGKSPMEATRMALAGLLRVMLIGNQVLFVD